MSIALPSGAMRTILERLAAEDAGLPDPTLLPPAEGRLQAAVANRRWNVDLPEVARVENLALHGGHVRPMAARIHVPQGLAGRGAILHIHGGGWAFCDVDTHERASRMLAIESGAAVLSFNYRLAPEHPHPAGLQDCVAAWRSLLSGEAGLKGPFAVAGDSAGANLAIALMLHEASQERTLPDAGLLFYGVYGCDFETASYREHADGPGLTRAKMMRYWDWYAPGAARRDVLAAPLLAGDGDLAALPPLYLNAAAIDPLRSDSELLYRRLTAMGRNDRYRLHAGVVHGFMQMSRELEEARLAFALAGEAFRSLARSKEDKSI